MSTRIAMTWLVTGLLLGPALGAAAADAPTSSLAEVVPSSVHFFVGTRNTPDSIRIVRQYTGALKQLARSGIGKDILELLTLDLPEDQRQQAFAMAQRTVEILGMPSWKDLCHEEVAYAFRMSFPIPEYVFIFRVPKDSSAARRGEFHKMLSAIAEFAPGRLSVAESQKRGADVVRLEAVGMPLALSAASKHDAASQKDMIILCTSDLLLDTILELVDSPDRAASLDKDPRFVAGMEGLDGRGESKVYFDMPGYIQFVSGILGLVAGGAQGDPNLAGVMTIARKVVAELTRIGPITGKSWAAKGRVIGTNKIPFVQGEAVGYFEALVRDQKPIEDFTRVIPKDALSFYMTSGVDLDKMYTALLDLIREHLPSGGQMLEKWERMQARAGFNLHDDLLSWLDGGLGWVVLPRKGGGTEWVFYLRLRDSEKAKAVLHKAFLRMKDFLASRGQSMEPVEVEKFGQDFHEIRIAAFPWMRPVVGFPGDTMVLASSAPALRRVADTFEGKAENFSVSKAYAAMEVPEGPLGDVWYTNLTGSLTGLADLTSAVGFVASILPEKQDTRHARKLGAILTKLSEFIRDVDIAVESSGWTRYDAEKHAIFMRKSTLVRPRKQDL